MKTTKRLTLVVSVLVIGGLTFTSPAVAGCRKKSKATSMNRTDQQASSQNGMQGMQMSDDMPVCGNMKMDKAKAEDQKKEGGSAMESMSAGDMAEMGDQKQTETRKQQAKKVEDPVCHMPVDPKLAEKSVYKGRTYYFCSKGDKDKFEESPEKYLKQEKAKE